MNTVDRWLLVHITTLRLALFAVALSWAGLMHAQPLDQVQVVEEILVTVQKRAEPIAEVPVAISALSGELISDVNLDDYKDLVAFTPGMTGNSKDSFTDVLQIRGIYTTDFGVGGDPSISFFKDGLYQGRSGAMVSSLYDIERTEVARGTQGFLLGRNSIAGAIDVITTRPSFDNRDAFFEVDSGQRGVARLEAASNLIMTDSFAARLAVYSVEEDGYVDDALNPANAPFIGFDKQAARLSLRSVIAGTELNFTAEYEDRKQSGTVYRALPVGDTWESLVELAGVSLTGDAHDVSSDFSLGNADNGEIMSFGLQIDHELGWATLSSLTGYKEHDWFYAEDYDGTPLQIASYSQDQRGDYLDQELRLVSSGNGAFSWYGGLYGYRENIEASFVQAADEELMCGFYLAEDGYANCTEYLADYDEEFIPNPAGLVEANDVIGDYWGFAGYLDLNYAFTDKLDMSLGARYTKDTKQFANHALPVDSYLGPFYGIGYTTDGFLEAEQDWSDVAPRVLLRFRPSPDLMVYASVSEGYKAGGFGSFAVNPEPEFGAMDLSQESYRPADYAAEQVRSYEIGSKHTLNGGLTRLDLAAYYFDYTDLQVVIEGEGGGIRVDNIGQVDGYGVEASLDTTLSENWDLLFTAAWAGSQMRGVQPVCGDADICEGKKLPDQPQFSYGAILQGHFVSRGGEWLTIVDATGQSDTFGGFSRNPLFTNQSWNVLGLQFGYESNSGWRAMTYVENALNEKYFDGIAEAEGILPAFTYGPGRPRTAGVRFSWAFN